ncbi:MAG: hypothetical protein V2J25_17035 [Desulfatiglans sp.]|nr:hypothetical protein [Desulfatiglans sp.]
MNRERQQQGRGALPLFEEAVHLLRRSPPGLLASYYIGSLPFILGLLFFWADMSRNPFAAQYCSPAALGLAILFIWMKCWQAVFTRKLWQGLSREPAPSWSLRRVLRLVVVQSFLQPSGLVVLPISLLIMFPFGWTYAFYQNVSVVTVEGPDARQGIKTLWKQSWDQAKLQPLQNHIMLSVLTLFSLFVFLNLAVAFILLPRLLKMFFGIDTMFVMSASSMLNTTFLAVTCGITYLCVDPLVKTLYTLRCFYGSSLSSGYDLKAELKGFLPSGRTIAAIMVFVFAAMPFSPLEAGQETRPRVVKEPASARSVSPKELTHAIEEVLKKREFAWRIPRALPKEEVDPKGPLEALMDWALEGVIRMVKTAARWMEAFVKWLTDLFPTSYRPGEPTDKGWVDQVRGLLLLMLAGAMGLSVVIFWRIRRGRKEAELLVVSEAKTETPDLTKEEIRADDLPVDGWLEVAGQLLAQGSWRLALRAFYLSILANLADHDMIVIAKHKSNHDYERELNRKAHDREEMCALFSKSVQIFESAWYGMKEVGREEVKAFASNRERITAYVEA